jgi:hypothetical protein
MTSFRRALISSGVKRSITSNTPESTTEYILFVPSFRHLIIPTSLRIFKWRETTGWIRSRCGTISQTHFSPFRKNDNISSLYESESAWKTFDLNRFCFSDFADMDCIIINNNILKLLSIIYEPDFDLKKATKWLKKHGMESHETKSPGTQP